MWNGLGSLALILLAMVPMPEVAQNLKPQTPATTEPKAAALTDEEKEIIRNREILDNLELLQNLEKIQYMGFLADKKSGKRKGKQGENLPAKDNAKKNNI